MDKSEQDVAAVAHDLLKLVPAIGELQAAAAQRRQSRRAEAGFGKWARDYWSLSIHHDGCRRLALLLGDELPPLTTMSVLGVTRYVFELTLWIKLVKLDSRYGYVYFRELMKTQLRYYEDTLAHLEAEAKMLEAVGAREGMQHLQVLARMQPKAPGFSPETITSEMRTISASIDAEVARTFSIFGDEALTNGYGFQAHLIRTKAIPPCQSSIDTIAKELAEFEERVKPDMLRPKAPKNWKGCQWKWKEQAEVAGALAEYNYIYSYTSKLLHGLPVSITTEQPSLHPNEKWVFLRYIKVEVQEMIETVRAALAA